MPRYIGAHDGEKAPCVEMIEDRIEERNVVAGGQGMDGNGKSLHGRNVHFEG